MGRKTEPWFLYIVKCADDSFYTGITKEIGQRLQAHNTGKGARYTRSHGPCELVYFERLKSIQEAMKREVAVKRMSRKRKESLVDSFPGQKLKPYFAESS